ncbi:trans-aconitate 2-methyltransferase (plasmid) [Piscirickettsia salmonis]|uniref:Methyltransferase n=1 Tax=Piscirickettsia salmonis TaxID=1238 RepID=A0AAC8VL50_PISSA|nr:class I SAM-dependent methyltransferase [Piscirickettsia salmonis]ALB24366.1 methyltransferase [Piscirickettsia salmonis]ALY04337.1 hypothetical protein AWE47_17385 [Piscirickettsia salmonis]AMA44084.1 hypothetical protein AWJ11_17045 [Piscirickettsia salmonis]AOS36869.1 hypothetical protein AVM72_15960 [Piscirickettsia salmonis]APS62318.1 hypothetical protein AVI53_17345 [Piscirickettsia salmonis]
MKLNQWNPKHYQYNSLIQQNNALDLLSALYTFHGNESILDIGCGDGKITSWIAQKIIFGQVIGIDKSFEMLQFAKQSHTSKNLIFTHCDINDSCFNEEFDLAVSFNCLHWIQGLNTACEKIFNAIKPGGIFLGLVYPRCDSLWIPAEKLSNAPEFRCYFKDFQNPYAFINNNDYKNSFKEASFNEVKITTIKNESKFKEKNEFTGYISGWLPHINAIPIEKQHIFLDQYYDLFMLETNQPPNTPFTLSYEQYNIWCHKKGV